ncbi:DNA-processing protein DprA [Candidatus Saccharibacteria bacterium]|nr:DNA-processing protein DprA [Candidatus Saccharibacteria bacterium]
MSTLFSHFFTNFNQIAPLEADFTEVLDAIAVKPKMLYFHGKLPENVAKKRPPVVAIVGARHNTSYGKEVAYKLAYELGKRGVVVMSGLAFGIDSIAHRGCLDAGGVTVAVLGTPITQIYPRPHLALAREIIEKNGAIISEYGPGEQVFPKISFLERNRLIAGLSDAVVIVEAAMKSGSLNTATHALSEGREVFAVPGNITNPYSQGCNKLISQGAIPYTEPADVIRRFFPEEFAKKSRKKRDLTGDTDVETAILAALGAGLRAGEEIMQAAKLPPEIFNEFITILEIKGRVQALGMNNWGLI